MKQRLINGLLALGIAVAMVSSLTAQTVIEGTAKVVRVKGPARFTTGNNIWQPLKPGDVLKSGTIVQTGKEAKSFVDIVLNDPNASMPHAALYNPSAPASSMSSSQPTASQNVVRIWENTALGIDKLTSQQTGNDVVSETQLDLRAGHITGIVKKMSAASRYEIKLPNGIAGIRGTTYDITSDGVLKVADGSVVIATVKTDAAGNTTSGQPQVVNGGWQFDARTDKMSELLPQDQSFFDKIIPTMRYIVESMATTISRDRTIYYEQEGSPTQGQNGQGQNNNNQGQNQGGRMTPR